jgi:hypothetical protein
VYSIQCNSQDSTYLIKTRTNGSKNDGDIIVIILLLLIVAPSLIALVHSFDLDLNLDLIVIPPALYSKDNTNDMA